MSRKSVEKIKTQKSDGQYEKKIKSLEGEIRRLKNELKTAYDALARTDDFLVKMTNSKTVEEVIKDVRDRTDIVVQDNCPNCGKDEMKKVNLGTFTIIVCTSCSYRNRVNAGNQPTETT